MDSSEVVPEGEWTTFYCDDGTPYYYNSRTQVTQWELPAEYAGLDSSAIEAPKDYETHLNYAEQNPILDNPEQHYSYASAGEHDALTPPPEDEATPAPHFIDQTQDMSQGPGGHGDDGYPGGALIDTLDPELPPPPPSWDASSDAALLHDDPGAGVTDNNHGYDQAEIGYSEDTLVALLSTAVDAARDDPDEPNSLGGRGAIEDQEKADEREYKEDEDTDSVDFDRVPVTMQSVERMNDGGVLDSFDAETYLGLEYSDDSEKDVDYEEVSGIRFDKDASFVDEMIRLGVCSAPSRALRVALDSGRAVPALRRRLEVFVMKTKYIVVVELISLSNVYIMHIFLDSRRLLAVLRIR
jgi:hypothetical protein